MFKRLVHKREDSMKLVDSYDEEVECLATMYSSSKVKVVRHYRNWCYNVLVDDRLVETFDSIILSYWFVFNLWRKFRTGAELHFISVI